MGRAAKREHLSRYVESRVLAIQETFQMFDEAASCSMEKVEWSQVITMGDDVSKQATITGMLWSGKTQNMGELEENIAVFCNVLQGFLLLCHGSTVGAGGTLHACILASAKKVVESSLALLRGVVSTYGIPGEKGLIPQLSGAVWEACTALKKTPTLNHVAIGRCITQVAVSIKDVLRELRELKPAEVSTGESTTSNGTCEEDDLTDDEFGNDLTSEEMGNAQLVINTISHTLTVMKELVHFISALLKQSNSLRNTESNIDSLESLLKYWQEIGAQIDELGACVYPPQEVQQIKTAAAKIADCADCMESLIANMTESSASVLIASLNQLKSSSMELQSRVACSDDLLVTGIEKLDLLT